ncbi:unnamed protein product [Rhizoctonia solani]|uniref:C2H2-type domain-containing protein n=1 Tax=Rhizoctonia solani TaxID=456999 RepID=A0A8H2Y416_9AGAM|nr:unnamed protein product [Rhizoctonia solani]
MHSRRSALGLPSAKDAPPSGLDEQQLDLYAATNTPLLRTDRLPPASFGPPPQSEVSRPSPPHFQPSATTDYSAELQLAELLMSDSGDSIGSAALNHLTLSAIVPMRSHQSGAKFANAPSRAHNRAAASRFDMRFASRSMPVVSTPAMPSLSWSSSSSSSSPATTSTSLSVDLGSTADHQVVSQPKQDTRHPSKLNTKHEPESPPTPTTRLAPTESTAPSPTSTVTTKRPARSARRSPAPRRQECTTCGKKFQRPCQLVTHIRSHTGEQPHACPVCARRFSVLSNCQRHVKLCQKRSVKVLNPSEEESTNDPAANATPFIQFSNDSNASQPASASAPEPTTRRSHEVPIRPKLVSRESGSTNSSVGGSNVGGALAQRPKPRSGSSSSVGSLAPKTEPPSMPVSLERRGSGSTVPVVPSSPAYSQASYPASYAYPQSNNYGSYGQGSFESSGSSYNNSAYGGGYGPSGSRYDQAAPGFEQANVTPGFEQASAAAYDSLNPSFTSSYENSVPAYGTSSPTFDRPEPGFNPPRQYGTTVAGPPHVQQPLPSPSHVQSTPDSAASSPAVSHDAGSYFPTVPGVYAAPSVRRPSVTSSVPSRRPTIAHTLVQRDQLGFRDAAAAASDPSSVSSTSETGSAPPTVGPGSYYSPNSCLSSVPYEAQAALKQEEAVPDLAHQVWPKQQSYQPGYSEPQWTPATGAEAPSFHAYHTGSISSTDPTGPHDNHVASAPTGYAAYPQQSRQQLYLQHAQGGYSNPSGQQQHQQQHQQQAQQHDAYGNGVYANRSTTYAMNSGVVSVPAHSHQDSSNYTWPGSQSAWNTQPDYRS